MIKVEHSVFALPFAMVGMLYAANGWPGWKTFGLIVAAMVCARSAAMAFNRIADREVDSLNPRTSSRALPSGKLKHSHAVAFLLLSCVGFFLSAAFLNRLTLLLAPLALTMLLFYSYTKRFTWLCHYFVGLSLGLAPAAAWLAVTGEFTWVPAAWLVAVTCWTAGFDILYALQDDEFDKAHRLQSIPARFGRKTAILVSRLSHVCAVAALLVGGLLVHAGICYYLGVVFVGALLAYEQSLVRPNDLSRLGMAFFTLNGYVSIGFLGFALADVALLRG
jgi:4-hydroxybenzoate polyprenyltransferase